MDSLPSFLPIESSDFPDPDTAVDGLLAVGSNLEVPTLLKAYRLGAFPWDEYQQLIFWHHPDPRFVLFPDNLRVSKSMQAVIRKNQFDFAINRSFEQVIRGCRYTKRNYQQEAASWITDYFEESYINFHKAGYAHSAEAWKNDELVGGLYGVRLGNVFFGESMFTRETNASKFAFIHMVKYLQAQGVKLIDCQMHSLHLESLGGEFISRQQFRNFLKEWIPE